MKTINKIPKNVTKFKIAFPLSKDVLDINKVFKDNGFQLFIVGGAVRDFLMDKPIKDFDLVTNAMPDKVEEILHAAGFKTLGTGKSFGVINVFTENDEFEIATMREDVSDENGKQGRHPEVKLGATIESDVKRRDLTLNALFFDIENGEIVDLVGGIEDIRNKVVRTVGNADDRFNEDRLRILRAVRFVNRLGISVKLDADIIKSIKNNPDLSGVSAERIRDEFLKSLKSTTDVNRLINMLDDLGLLQQIFGDLKLGNKFIEIPNVKDHILVMALLLRFNNTDDIKRILNKLTHPKADIEAIAFLVIFQRLHEKTGPILKKLQAKTLVDSKMINKFAKMIGMNEFLVEKFNKFKLSVKGDDVMRDFNLTGKELGEKIIELEIENFENLMIKL